MVTLCKTYSDESAARQAAEALRNERQRIHLVAGCRRHDVRYEPTGGFAGPVPPDAPVGSFGNHRHLRREGNGTFAGDADRQREGTFSDSDRDVIVDYDHGGEHAHVAGDRTVRQLLHPAAGDAADEYVDALHEGRVVLVAEEPAGGARAA
jgi:hypothetical protein